MKGIRVHRLLALGGIAALVIVYPLLWLRMIRTPAERSGSDFIRTGRASSVIMNQKNCSSAPTDAPPSTLRWAVLLGLKPIGCFTSHETDSQRFRKVVWPS